MVTYYNPIKVPFELAFLVNQYPKEHIHLDLPVISPRNKENWSHKDFNVGNWPSIEAIPIPRTPQNLKVVNTGYSLKV